MAATETWVLAGTTLTSGNFDILELNTDPPKARPDWISAADSEGAALLRQPQHENRTVTMKLRVTAQASMNAALDQVGAIRDKLRSASATPDGIALVWTPANSTRSVTFDVLAGEIPEMPIGLDGQAWSWFKQRPIFTIEMTCKPYWRGTETLTSTASSSTPFVTLEVAGVTGDVPALGRLIVTDTATQLRRHVEWGLENQYYNSGLSLLVDSDSMTVSGFAGSQTTRSGAYDPNATGNNVIRTTLDSRPTACCGTGSLSHVGTYRVKARVWSLSSNPKVRLAWQEGDGPFMANPFVAVPTDGWSEIDLGTVIVDPVLTGTQRWTGRIEAYSLRSDGTADTLDVDYLTLVPAGEGYGKARATYSYSPGVVVGRDEFTGTTSGGALNARVAPAGGTWATTGAATDWAFADGPLSTEESVLRTSAAVETFPGRIATLGSTNYTNVEVASWIQRHAALSTMGVVARFVDINNLLVAYNNGGSTFVLRQIVAGTVTTLGIVNISTPAFAWLEIRLVAFASGRILAVLKYGNGGDIAMIEATSTAVATGGALATGKPGIMDQALSATAPGSRYYDNFYVATPSAEPVAINTSRTLEFRYDDTIRGDSAGTVYGRPQSYNGSRFLVPPGTSRVLVKARRNDVDTSPDDSVTDATQIQVGYTPRGLVVPR